MTLFEAASNTRKILRAASLSQTDGPQNGHFLTDCLCSSMMLLRYIMKALYIPVKSDMGQSADFYFEGWGLAFPLSCFLCSLSVVDMSSVCSYIIV